MVQARAVELRLAVPSSSLVRKGLPVKGDLQLGDRTGPLCGSYRFPPRDLAKEKERACPPVASVGRPERAKNPPRLREDLRVGCIRLEEEAKHGKLGHAVQVEPRLEALVDVAQSFFESR